MGKRARAAGGRRTITSAKPRATDSDGFSPGAANGSFQERGQTFPAFIELPTGVPPGPAIKRRTARRMAALKLDRMSDYSKFLQSRPREIEAPRQPGGPEAQRFFRARHVFKALQNTILPNLLASKPAGDPVRIWVPCCSTGAEAYSVAICALEALGERAAFTRVQVFASDVDERNIVKARAGVYSPDALRHMPQKLLRHFFARSGENYRISFAIRKCCIFARHDLAQDPPYSKLDLISWRNVPTNVGAAAQEKIQANFHYALRDGGVLLLGKSGSHGVNPQLFTLADRKNKIFKKSPDHSKIQSLARMMNLQEAGFKELARELHDDLSQKLAALGMQVSKVLQGAGESQTVPVGPVREMNARISAMAVEVHALSRRLHPAVLDELGLEAALREECLEFSAHSGIPARFKSSRIPAFLSENVALTLYRVAQESLRNVARHAEANSVRVSLSGYRRGIELAIEDTGSGFQLREVRGKGGLGLISMEERVRLAGGEMTIQSQEGVGTKVKVVIPLDIK